MSTNLPDTTWNRRTAGGIPYKLVKQSGGIQDYQVSASEEIIIQANQLRAFGLECFPAPIWTIGGLYYPPRRRFPGLSHLHVVNLRWEAMDDGKPVDPFLGGHAPTYYEHVRINLDYAPAPTGTQDPSQDDPLSFLQISASNAGTFIHGDLNLAKDEDGKENKDPLDENRVLSVEVEWTLQWPMIPADFFDDVLVPRMRERIGMVNSRASRVWKNAPKETILFVGYDFNTERSWVPDEGVRQAPIQCTMKFMEKNFKWKGKQITHQHTWMKGGKKEGAVVVPKGWQKLVYNDGSNNYETADLDKIFFTG